MGIEDLKRWHWIVIGTLVGLGLAYVWLGVEPPSARSASAQEFLRDVVAVDDEVGARVRRVVIHPAQPNFEAVEAGARLRRYEAEAHAAEKAAKNPPADVADRAAFVKQKQEEAAVAHAAAERMRVAADRRVNRVTYKRWMYDPRAEKHVLVDRFFIAEVPFVPPGTRSTNVDPNMTIARHLDELNRRHDHIGYTHGWWSSTPAAVAIWTAGSVAVIGLLWPIVLNALIGAGYGPKPRPKPEYDLSRFGRGGGKGSIPEPSKPVVTAEEQQRLRDMTEQLERNLAASGTSTSQPASPGAAEAEPVRKLDGGPLEIAPMSKPEDEDEIEVKGEYYPVLIHHKKHHDDTPGEEKKE